MTQLKIYSDKEPNQVQNITEFDSIRKSLREIGLDIERWIPKNPLSEESTNEEIIDAYSKQITFIKNSRSFKGVDVISMNRTTPKEQVQVLREKFLKEHTHSDDEVRYFIEGSGLFVVHHEDKVYSILCKAGDFISVPAMTKHWFDMGSEPNFRCIRFFSEESGWLAEYTGDDLAHSFPNLDDLKCLK
jgi:1,2-dihydroxy-3-keto-5-methylthiopentene dioxygenase